MTRLAVQILWPAFLMAGVFEMLLFAVVDPGQLQWFGGPAVDWPRVAVYSVTFGLCWATTSTASALTVLLLRGSGAVNRNDPF
ncbi:MAG: hypothetical protein ABW067_05340 [Rhizobacter sp.]